MRQSLRTYELFEVARLILEKPDRYQIGLRFHGNEAGQHGVRPLYQSVPDGLPFLSEEAAVDHVMRNHLDLFFAVEEVEVDPPKGNFQFIARCTLTGEFLSPPNYHRYQPILLQYHQERFPDMPFDRFRSQIETVKDEEAIGQWLQSMTKQTRFRVVGGAEGEGETLDSPEAARVYLLRQGKEKVVQPVKSLKFSGKLIDALSSPDIRPYVVAFVEHQKRFPLDTANTLRGRLRRQHFFIYKKGSRGVSLVCAVKRKFRQPNQVFSDSVQALINFLEANDQIHASELSEKFLGFSLPGEGEERVIDAEEQAKIKRLSLDLRWLLSEGYVTEYSDGRLSVHPVAAQGGEKKPSAKAKAGDESSSIPDKPAEEPVETPPEEPAVSSAPDRVSEAVQDEERGQPEQEADSSEKPEPPVSIATDSGGGEDREAERADPEEGVSSGSERPKEG